jgi:hypothetical protein
LSADEIKALVERLRNRAAKQDKEGDMHSMRKAADTLETFTQDIEALTLENQRLRVDAERYRWLRNEANKEPAAAPFVFFCDPNLPLRWVDAIYGEQLDADIDAARAQIDKETQ